MNEQTNQLMKNIRDLKGRLRKNIIKVYNVLRNIILKKKLFCSLMAIRIKMESPGIQIVA